MSNELSSVFATRFVSAASRLTPRLMLPDLTITALLAASLIFASSAALSPVVPMMCSLPALATSLANSSVALGAVKSTMPSAFESNGPASPVNLTPFSGSPASTPASQPTSGERASSMAPASTNSSLSAIALTSVRPIRPPAPATTSRISAIGQLPKTWRRYSAGAGKRRLRLQAVVTLDNHDIRGGMRLAQLHVRLIFRRIVASERGRIVLKLDDYVAGARVALDAFELAGAHDVTRSVFLEYRLIAHGVGLVALVAFHIDSPDPVTLRHAPLPMIRPPVRSQPRLHLLQPWVRAPQEQ